jgi:hypothetical protein
MLVGSFDVLRGSSSPCPPSPFRPCTSPPRLLSLGQVEDLRAQLAAKEAALEELRAMTPEAMWLRDLDAVEEGA